MRKIFKISVISYKSSNDNHQSAILGRQFKLKKHQTNYIISFSFSYLVFLIILLGY